MRCLAAEFADAFQRQRELRRFDQRQRVVDSRCVAAVHFADEPQRQMQLLARLPVRAGHAGLQQRKIVPRSCPAKREQRTVSWQSQEPAKRPERQTLAEDKHDQAIDNAARRDRQQQQHDWRCQTRMDATCPPRTHRAIGAPRPLRLRPARRARASARNPRSAAASPRRCPSRTSSATLIQAPSDVPSAMPAMPRWNPHTSRNLERDVDRDGRHRDARRRRRVVARIERGLKDARQRHGRKPHAISRQRNGGQRRGVFVERAMSRRSRA